MMLKLTMQRVATLTIEQIGVRQGCRLSPRLPLSSATNGAIAGWSRTSERGQAGFLSEPLGPQHDRAAFSCEVEPLERHLKQQANQDVRKDLSVTYVLAPAENRSRIAGYYTVCADTIPIDDLPPELVKKLRLPHYKTLPATLVGRLARDLTYKGKGLDEILLADALKLSWDASQQVASWAVTVDAKYERARRFYLDFGFIPFADTERRLYLPMWTVEQLLSSRR
jgi:GNAT superfamily N-acetyltransferase